MKLSRLILLSLIFITFSFTCFAQISPKQLYKAVINGEQQVLKMAINQGIDINQVDKNGIPLLNHAVNFNQLAMVKQLIRLGAKVNQGDKSGFTPLLVAVTYLHTDIAEELIKNYADVNLADKDGLSPLKQAQIKGDKNLHYLLIRALEKQQHFNLATPKALAAAIYETAKNKFYGIEKITRIAAPKTHEQVISHYKNIPTKQGGSLVLRVLSSDKAKAYTAFNDYLSLLKLAKQHIPQKYWLAEFGLYSILNDASRFQQPLRGMMIENQRLNFLLDNINQAKELILKSNISSQSAEYCSRQADLDIEYLLREKTTSKLKIKNIQLNNTYIYQQQQSKLNQLLTLIENNITDYCFSDIIATLASPDTANWLKERVNKKLQEKIKRNNTEKYVLYIMDWQNNTYITINVWLKAQHAPAIINAIKNNSLDAIHQVINTMESPTQEKLIDYLLPVFGLNKTDIDSVELIQAKINNKNIDYELVK